jgi:hypothetical protein
MLHYQQPEQNFVVFFKKGPVPKYPHALVQCELEKHHVKAYAYSNLHKFTTRHAYITNLSGIPNLIKIHYYTSPSKLQGAFNLTDN